MRICTLLLFLISTLTCHSLYAHTPESSYFLMQDSTSSLTSLNLPAKPKKTKELFQQNFSYMGIPFIVSGLIVKKQNQDFRTLRNRFQPTFHHEYDNYTQYVPLVATWGMKLAGVESRSSWKELTVSNLEIYDQRNAPGQFIKQFISFRTYSHRFYVRHNPA